MILKLKEMGIDLETENDVAGFLGIHMHRSS